MKWIVLVLIAIVGFGACAVLDTNPELAAQMDAPASTPAPVRTAAPTDTATQAATETPDWPRATVNAAAAEQSILAVECTRVALANTEAAGVLSRDITRTAAAISFETTNTAIAATAQHAAELAYQEQRAQVLQATAQAETILTARLQSATPAAATAEALSRAVELDRNYYEFQSSPAKQVFDAILPLIVIMAVIAFASYILQAAVRAAERRAFPGDFDPVEAEQVLPAFRPVGTGATLKRIDDLDVEYSKIVAAARRWAECGRFRVRSIAVDTDVYGPKVMSQGEYKLLQDWMISSGLMDERYQITAEGAEWLKEVAGDEIQNDSD